LVPIFLWHAVARRSFRWAVPRTVAYTVIAGLPTAAWIAYGLIVRDFLRGQASDKFQLEFFSHASTWRGWVSMSGEVLDPAPWLDDYSGKLGVIVLGLGILCTAASSRSAQRILIPLWVGYVLFGITFITHTATHNYYSLMLIPIVALAVGAALPRVSAALARPYLGERQIAAATTLALVAGALALHGDLVAASYPRTAATYARIGDLIGHRSAIVLAYDFGEPLEYHGGFRNRSWPFPDDIPAAERGVTVAARLAPANRDLWPAPGDMNPAPSFFVVDSNLLGPQPELRRYLDALPLVGYVERFRVYRLRGRSASSGF
jgi:hypothetical protein